MLAMKKEVATMYDRKSDIVRTMSRNPTRSKAVYGCSERQWTRQRS